MPLVVILRFLEQDCFSYKVQVVYFNSEWYRSVWEGYKQDYSDSHSYFDKDILLVQISNPSSITTSDIKERAGYIQKTRDEPTIKVGEFQKLSDI